jgi:hypothetical protein
MDTEARIKRCEDVLSNMQGDTRASIAITQLLIIARDQQQVLNMLKADYLYRMEEKQIK